METVGCGVKGPPHDGGYGPLAENHLFCPRGETDNAL